MRKLSLGCLGLIVVPILLLVVIGTVAKLGRPVNAAQAPTRIASWSADGDLTTQPITIAGSSVRLDLTTSRQVCITVRRMDGWPVRAECRQASGPSYLYAAPGRYYLEIKGMGSWSMTATDLP